MGRFFSTISGFALCASVSGSALLQAGMGEEAAIDRCSAVYARTAKAMRTSSKQLLMLGVGHAPIGAAMAAGGAVYYTMKELRDAANVVIGTEKEGDSRLDSAGRVVMDNPAKAVGSVVLGSAVAALGGPVGLVGAPIVRYQASRMKAMSQALASLGELPATSAVSEDTKFGKRMKSLHNFVNRKNGLGSFHRSHKRYVGKQDIVRILRKLNTNEGLCPDGAVYNMERVRRIVRDFSNKEGYTIPKKVYKKSNWFQQPLFEQIKNPEKYVKHTRAKRMQAVKNSAEKKVLYTGMVGAQ